MGCADPALVLSASRRAAAITERHRCTTDDWNVRGDNAVVRCVPVPRRGLGAIGGECYKWSVSPAYARPTLCPDPVNQDSVLARRP